MKSLLHALLTSFLFIPAAATLARAEKAAADPPAMNRCDQLAAQGRESFTNGAGAKALTEFEASMGCSNRQDLAREAVMAACMAKDESSAKRWFKRVKASQRNGLSPSCMQHDVDLKDPTKPRCEELKAQGDESYTKGAGADALQKYEAAMACSRNYNLAFQAGMAACVAKDEKSAKRWLDRAKESKKIAVLQKCHASGLKLDAPPAKATGK